MQSANMTVSHKKAKVLCVIVTLNIFICVLMGLKWNFGTGQSRQQKVRIPSQRFWHQRFLSESFWNKEQQLLDVVHNPVMNSALSSNSTSLLPGWINDICEPDYRVPAQISDYNTLPQRFRDFLLHMHCRTYPMLINQPHICQENPFLLLVVKSLIPHFDRRQAIRQTWGHAGILANRTVVTVFLLGSTLLVESFPDLQGMLVHEGNFHKDLLQWDYRDTFFNLTLKEVLFLEWFSQHCPQAQYVLKGDDDVFVNTLRVLDFLDGLSEFKAKDLFIGDVISDAGPQRDKRLKYFIPESVFVGEYPPYAGGGGYLLSGELALRLYNVSQEVVLYPIDDVYTGMCLKKLGLAPEKHSGFRTFDIEEKFRRNPCIYRGLMLVHNRTPQDMLKLWPWIVRPELDCQ
ncbi:N-acetyllactosaminide beta-1,3-N-acetylglucosaminyltransferase 2a [Nothobranchius furzeri]|nr:N-acetyllactosaminide beta-1,3-N-acetylglucosaminyltransferase 2-like [Nothobranchius furzeri]